jgi:hypothetical protein
MHRPNAPISLADLAAAGVRLRPYEAVTVVRELLLQVARGEVAGVPSAHVIRLSSAGAVSVEGPVGAGGRPVLRAAELLDSLLPGPDAGSQFRVPGGLKLVTARALGTLDLPPFPSLEGFAEALERFAASNPTETIGGLVQSWSDVVAVEPDAGEAAPAAAAEVQPFISSRTQDIRAHLSREPLTVSDIRRARRASGLPLAVIAERSHIPVSLLRQLEWGYFINWPEGQYGRSQVVRYARAAGLDEDLVVSTLIPLIQQVDRPARAEAGREMAATTLIAEPMIAGPIAESSSALIFTPRLSHVRPSPAADRRRRLAAAALAIPALLAIGLLPAWWARQSSTPRPAPVQAVAPRPAPASQPAVPPARSAESARTKPPAALEGAARAGRQPGPDTRTAPQAPVEEGAEYRLASDRGALSPAFASVGTAAFYHDSARGPSAARDAAAPDGSVLKVTRIVDDSSSNFHARPSPDGTRIAFDSNRDGARGVYVANADGQHVKRVSGDGFAALPSWSPDGRRLAFVRADALKPGVWNLWTLDLAKGDMRQITRLESGQPWGGSWFPDGRRIAYGNETKLVIIDLQTGRERTFDTPRKGHLIRTPAVSPDGQRVVFQVHRDGTWLLELGNGSMRRVLEDPAAQEYTWAPDGRRVAYYSPRAGGWGVWVMAPR